MTLDDYTIYCTKEQTKKALELGAEIEHSEIGFEGYDSLYSLVHKNLYAKIPTAEQMIGWLESKGFYFRLNTNGCSVEIDYSCILEIVNTSRKKATLQAIDTALDYYINVLNNKK